LELEPLLFPDGVPADLTLAQVVKALGAAADRAYSKLATADVELAKELSDDGAHRDERDEAVAHLRVIIAQQARGAMVAGWGAPALAKVKLAGELPDNPSQLAQTARTTADLVETAELGEPS